MASMNTDPSLELLEHELESTGEQCNNVFVSSVARVPYGFNNIKEQCIDGPPPPYYWRWSLIGYLAQKLGGNFCYEPEDLMRNECDCSLSEGTQQILRERVFHDLDPRDVMDYHCHIVGHGDSGSQCYIHDSLKTWWNPVRRFKAAIFMAASQVTSIEGGDMQFISRLVRLVRHFVPTSCTNVSLEKAESKGENYLHGKCCMLAFDKFVDPHTHEEDDNRTTFYIPNEYSLQLAREFPDLFLSVGSVNPYRTDAIKRLQHLSELGVTIIKWLPNSMGIDPSDESIEPFYNKMKELNMILLVHCGEEHTVDAAFINNALGNPLLLRRPLNCGVKIITAHCASEGYAIDTDNGDRRRVPCFDLWLRLMREDKYKGLLYGDISAICAVLRVSYLHQLMQATDVHDRLVYGSDYPVPAINAVVHTSRLNRFGLITQAEKRALDELYSYNPLLFDVASKRLLRGPNNETFPTQLFRVHPALPPVAISNIKAD